MQFAVGVSCAEVGVCWEVALFNWEKSWKLGFGQRDYDVMHCCLLLERARPSGAKGKARTYPGALWLAVGLRLCAE